MAGVNLTPGPDSPIGFFFAYSGTSGQIMTLCHNSGITIRSVAAAASPRRRRGEAAASFT